MSIKDSRTDRKNYFTFIINRKSPFLAFLITAFAILFLGTIQSAAAEPVISFDNGFSEYTLNDFAIITVDDSGNAAFTDPDSGIQTITVTITSSLESKTITLTETDITSGIFTNTSLIFTEGDDEFTTSNTVTVTQEETIGLTPDVDTITVDVTSTDPLTGTLRSSILGFVLTETGLTTEKFTNTLTFTTGSTTGNAIQVADGDRIAINYQGEFAYGLISPNPNVGVRTINVANCGPVDVVCDMVTVSYTGAADNSLSIVIGSGGGGSGGGLLRPGFVLNVLGGTSGGDFAAPQLTLSKLNIANLPLVGDILDFILNADPFTPITPLDDPSIDYPLSINGNGYLLTQFANTIETYTGKTGEPVSFKMTLFDATGIEHIALYTNLRGDAREIEDSDTFVIYHEDKPLEITDPHGFFSNVNFTESEYGGKYIAEFNMTFAKPMDTSDVIIRTWDELLNSGDVKVLDAIKIEGEPIVNPNANNLIIPDSAEIVIPYYKLPFYEITNADSNGNLIYYNSFGGREEKQMHPYHTPIVYPDEIGKNERHDDGFDEAIINEDVRAQTIAQTIIGNPFTESEHQQQNMQFTYSDHVGKLDRENKDALKKAMMNEQLKAAKQFSIYYRTNHVQD
jgi:hypothetical protein